MARHGFILQASGDTALVSSSKRSICAECSDKGSCGLEDGHASDLPEEITVLNPVGAKPGDWVEFDLPGHTELRLSFIIWVVPLIGLLAGAALAGRIFTSASMSEDAMAAIGGVAGFILAFVPIMIYDRWMAKGKGVKPIITKIVTPVCSVSRQAGNP